jgi:hypothetical protein
LIARFDKYAKYVAACECSEVRSVTAEPNIRPIDKGLASTSLIAAIAVMKYADHLPLARQATQILKRSHVELSQSSRRRWMRNAACLLEPLSMLIWDLILQSFCRKIDATNGKRRDPNGKGKCIYSYVWGAVGDESYPYNIYFFRRDGTRAGLKTILKGFHNTLQCDANSIYDEMFTPKNLDALLVPREQGCWSHTRRKFTDALIAQPDAKYVLHWIGAMYGVERRVKKLTNEERLLIRQQESVPLLDKVFTWRREHKDNYMPKDLLYQAIQ